MSTRGKLLIVDVSKLAQGWSCAGQEATFTLCMNKVLVWVDKEMCGIFVLEYSFTLDKKKKKLKEAHSLVTLRNILIQSFGEMYVPHTELPNAFVDNPLHESPRHCSHN